MYIFLLKMKEREKWIVVKNLHEREFFDENFADLQRIFVGYLQSWFYWDLQA